MNNREQRFKQTLEDIQSQAKQLANSKPGHQRLQFQKLQYMVEEANSLINLMDIESSENYNNNRQSNKGEPESNVPTGSDITVKEDSQANKKTSDEPIPSVKGLNQTKKKYAKKLINGFDLNGEAKSAILQDFKKCKSVEDVKETFNNSMRLLNDESTEDEVERAFNEVYPNNTVWDES